VLLAQTLKNGGRDAVEGGEELGCKTVVGEEAGISTVAVKWRQIDVGWDTNKREK
jgi:hypothetical protein